MAETFNPLPIEILLVDDNDDDVVLLEESFRDSKFLNLMQVVHDGEEAVAYLRREGQYRAARTPGPGAARHQHAENERVRGPAGDEVRPAAVRRFRW